MITPQIFTAFAYSEEKEHLKYLGEEDDSIRNLFYPLFGKGIINILPHGHTTSDKFYRVLSTLKDRINIIHYGGHANNFHLDLEKGTYNLRQFSEILKGKHSLKLVFLNGCATSGFVDTLLKDGVKAVIATKRKIGDLKAKKFAIEFYTNLLMENKNLHDAFYNAASIIEGWDNSEKVIYRDLDEDEEVDETDKTELEWGLYIKKENKYILNNWILNDGKSKNEDPELGQSWMRLVKKYEDLEKEIEELKLILEDVTDVIELNSNKMECEQDIVKKNAYARKVELKEEYGKKIEQDIINKEEESIAAFRELSDLTFQKIEERRKNKLITALKKINFTNEINSFKGNLQKLQPPIKGMPTVLGAFVVRGSPKCGLSLLEKRMVSNAEIMENEKVEFLFDFKRKVKPLAPTKNSIWLELLNQSKEVNDENVPKVQEIGEAKKLEIVKWIFKEHLKLRNVLFIFKNMDNIKIEKSKEFIKDFWFTFSKIVIQFKQKELSSNKEKSMPAMPEKKILAFFIDDYCHLGEKEKELCLFRDYSNFLTKDEQKIHSISLLPIPNKIEENELQYWYANSGVSITGFKPQSILGPEGDFVLPTIKKICEQSKLIDYDEEKFPKFDEIINPPL